MPLADTTSWDLLRSAAAGEALAQAEFVRRYQPVIRSYLAQRWRRSPLHQQLDDAVHETLLELFRPGGALGKADPMRGSGFRALLFGVVRNVALRYAERAQRRQDGAQPPSSLLGRLPADDAPLSAAFDRAWALGMVRAASARMAERAALADEGARRRVELLRLRFHDGLPIRDIAARWQQDAAFLHHEYAKARREFELCLREVIAAHHPGDAAAAEREFQSVLEALL
jgi:RNA polymerase sigma-70 factor (ECF subfamily)